MATVLTETPHKLGFLVSEAPGHLSRETVTVTLYADLTYPAGTVLAMFTATEKYVPPDLDATTPSDGSETAVAILADELVELTGSDQDVEALIIRRHAEVNEGEVQFKKYDLSAPDGLEDMSGANITATKLALAAAGVTIIAREAV